MKISAALDLISSSKHIVAFTGAGISVASGIPPFRGEKGLWSKYDPIFLDLNFFMQNPLLSWKMIKEIFYDFFGQAQPNQAHKALAYLEEKELLEAVITQNIDSLHQQAGSKNVIEYHGNSRNLVCLSCDVGFPVNDFDLSNLPPYCPDCQSLLKPDFVFFNEGIPEEAAIKSSQEALQADLFILIGTTGEIIPASYIPFQAKDEGAKIIEINSQTSNYTNTITDIFLRGKAEIVLPEIIAKLEY